MNELFLKDLAKKTRRGQIGVIKDGRSAGGRCYGYDIVPGEAAGVFMINERQANVIRRVFELYLQGESPRAIARRLNSEGVPGPRGGAWRSSTIIGQKHSGNGILNNELYIGRRIWNRRRKVTDPTTGKKRMRANPKAEWIIIAAPDLRILEDKLWRAAKEKQAKLSGKRGGARRPTRLLSGLIACGNCGGPMSVCSSERYGCSTRRETGNCDNKRTVKVADIERPVLKILSLVLQHLDCLSAANRAYREELATLEQVKNNARIELQKSIADTKRRIDHIIDAIENGVASDSMKERLMELDAMLKVEEASRQAMDDDPTRPSSTKTTSMAVDLGSVLERAAADRSLKGNQAQTIVRQMVDEVVVSPGKNDEPCCIDFKGTLSELIDQNDTN